MALNPKPARRKLAEAYRSVAIIVFNTLGFLLVVNVVLWAVFESTDQQHNLVDTSSPLSRDGYFRENGTAVDNGKRMPTNLTIFDYTAFEDVMSEREISAMLDEYYDHFHDGLKYQAFTQYAPRVFSGDYLNVVKEPNGLTVRRTINPRRDPEAKRTIRIFAFGGSTTFGQGVADKHTWPAQLSEILNARAKADGLHVNVEVTNYGRVGFYPTQELHLLMEILRSGERPDIAIFLDGLNLGEDNDTSGLTKNFSEAIDEAQHPTGAQWKWIPMIRAAAAINERINPSDRVEKVVPSEEERLKQARERFVQFRMNVEAVSELYGVKPIFFLQPDAHYNYPAELYARGEILINPPRRAFKERLYAELRKDDGFIDLTGLFRSWGNRKAVIDSAHFSPNFSRFVAENIATHINLDEIDHASVEDPVATGIPK